MAIPSQRQRVNTTLPPKAQDSLGRGLVDSDFCGGPRSGDGGSSQSKHLWRWMARSWPRAAGPDLTLRAELGDPLPYPGADCNAPCKARWQTLRSNGESRC